MEAFARSKASEVKKAQHHVGTRDYAHPALGFHLSNQVKNHAEGTAIQVGAEFEIEKDVSVAGTYDSLSRLRKLRSDRVVSLSYDCEHRHAI